MASSEGDTPTDKMIVEEGVGPDVAERVQRMAKEAGDDTSEKVQVIPTPKEEEDTGPEVDANKLDAEGNPKPPTEEEKKQAEEAAKAQAKKDEEAKKKKDGEDTDDQDTTVVDPLDGEKVKLTLHGEEKEFTYHELRAGMGRQAALQRQLNTLSQSEEMQLGTLMIAAKGGDKAAAKKVQSMLMQGLGKDSADDLNDELDGVEGEFDENAKLAEKRREVEFAEVFSDLDQESVEFKDNMNIVNTTLKARIPEKVFDAFQKDAHTNRAMYDLAASGRSEVLINAFDQHFNTLPFEKQLEINSDPAAFGDAFMLVVKRENAKLQKPKQDGSETGKSALESVSGSEDTATRNPDSQKPAGAAPDFLNMTSEQFAEFKRKNRLA